MYRKIAHLLILLFSFTTAINAQLGIKAGVNLANEIRSFSQSDLATSFSSKNLTGYQIGLTYQIMPKKSGFGLDLGAIISQKGSSYIDSTSYDDMVHEGYSEKNYLEIPIALRYRLKSGFFGLYGTGGIYGAYALNGKVVDETANNTNSDSYKNLNDHLDYGLNFGFGIELQNKIQLGTTWSKGLKNTVLYNPATPSLTNKKNKVFTINLVYMF